MRRELPSGILLIVGSLVGVVVMLLHPTGHDLVTATDVAAQMHLAAGVHAAALASLPLLFLGQLGLARRLGSSDLTRAALVAYAFGGVAVAVAAVMSGFVAPPLLAQVAAGGDPLDIHHALAGYTGLINQAFAKVFVVASSVAILLWSFAILIGRQLARAAGIAGLLAGGGILTVFLAGYLRLDVHGFGIVTFAQAAWLVWVGTLLLRDRREPHGTNAPRA